MTALVGPSGCGKTTTLKMINRLVEPTSRDDRAVRQGRPLPARARAAPRHRLRDPAQRAVPAPHDRGEHRARCRSCSDGTRRASAHACDELVDLVGLLPELLPRYPAALSGGQQQRVGVARALAADPPVLLDGRAVQRRRPDRARCAYKTNSIALQRRVKQDDRVRHPRHRRSDQACRPGRAARRRGRHRAVRPARRVAATRRRPRSSSRSSATSGPCGGSRCAASSDADLGPLAGATGGLPTVRDNRRPSRGARRAGSARRSTRRS